MLKDVMFYVMCALIAALIFFAIEYKKEIEHNRVLDEILVEILDKGRVEVIDVINEILTRSDFTAIQGFCLGNVLKYILRADMKNGKEDYKKAQKYLEWLIQSM